MGYVLYSLLFSCCFLVLRADYYKGKYVPASYKKMQRKVYLPTTKFRSSYPFITASTFRGYADHILDAVTKFKPKKVKCGDIVFVQIDFLDDFIKHDQNTPGLLSLGMNGHPTG